MGTFAPVHNDIGLIATERLANSGYAGDASTVEGYIRESILEPAIYIVPDYLASSHPMPAFTYISDADVDALVYLLAHQTMP